MPNISKIRLYLVLLFNFKCLIVVLAKNSKNCDVEFHICSKNDDLSICEAKLEKCIKSQHYNNDMIPMMKRDFMTKFKCCYQELSMCIEKEIKKEDVQLRECSTSMLKCVKGKRSKLQFVKESPKSLRPVFGSYGQCVRTHCLNDCVKEYYNNMEDLLGMDCLNKYINCLYSSGGAKHDSCHDSWETCMIPNCENSRGATFKTKLIKGIWNCKKEPSEGDYITKTLKCILELHKDGISMSHWLTIEHVREACFLVYVYSDIGPKIAYKQCVENNRANSIDSTRDRAKKRMESSTYCN